MINWASIFVSILLGLFNGFIISKIILHIICQRELEQENNYLRDLINRGDSN